MGVLKALNLVPQQVDLSGAVGPHLGDGGGVVYPPAPQEDGSKQLLGGEVGDTAALPGLSLIHILTECISEGLYRIPVPLPGNPLRELNSYLLRGRERSLLIDTGFRQEEGRRALFAGLAELDVDPRDVDVALTHLHSDHSGLAPEVVGETGWIYVSGPDRAYLEQPEDTKWAHTDAFYISEGFPPELLAQNRANPARALAPVPTGRYRTLEPGAVLEAGGRRLTCLPAPGHTPGQLCFWDESDGILFTGDHVLFDISPNITPWNGMEDEMCIRDRWWTR